jgi:hypothetical protein
MRELGPWRTLCGAALSLIAGLVHTRVMPKHPEKWWGYGAFFLLAVAAQVLYAPLPVVLLFGLL